MLNEALPRIAVILGPTASGKSALALRLCAEYGGEIVSADSMQVYRGMDIGTAKPSPAELSSVRHHLIDIRSIAEKFCAADFINEASAAIADIVSRGKQPYIVGGTGMYSDMLFNTPASPEAPSDPAVRASLIADAAAFGSLSLWDRLNAIDSQAAESVHPNNVKRVARYIEIYLTTGMTPTAFNAQSKRFTPVYSPVFICLDADTDEIYPRIDKRCGEMLERGLLNEVGSLCEKGLRESPTASQAIGYKEFFPYFDGTSKLGDCVSLFMQHSRNYAKRQRTYFRRLNDIHYIPTGSKAFEASSELLGYR